MKERNLEPTSIKIPKGLLESIDKDIENNGDFRNRSEWIIAAIRFYELERIRLLKERKEVFEKSDCNFTPSGGLHGPDQVKEK